MSMITNLSGRLRNTSLPFSHALMPLFEAVVNSIHSIEEISDDMSIGKITVEIIRTAQSSISFDDEKDQSENIVGFKIIDNGIGFNDKNLESFETLDSDHKIDKGCRGVGRLLWLKAFKRVTLDSAFSSNSSGALKRRTFRFDAKNGVNHLDESHDIPSKKETIVFLEEFVEKYRQAAPKTLRAISNGLLEHCLWYFVRPGGVPNITIKDGHAVVDLDVLIESYMHDSAVSEEIEINGTNFFITHIKLRSSSAKPHALSYCAANRLVKEEPLTNKIPGLHGKISDEQGDFSYCCYVGSEFLDKRVRSERTGFNIEENIEGLFEGQEISFKKIRESIYPKIQEQLSESLQANIEAGKERLSKFVAEKAPRYRPIINRISENDLVVDSNFSDNELDLFLHKQLMVLEQEILKKGHSILSPEKGETSGDYLLRVQDYLSDVSDMKKSDLADYLCHRKVIIDLFEKALEKDESGKYSTEDIIHQLIMPMGEDSNNALPSDCNLWLIDEKLSFHDYLASDKSLDSMPVTGSTELKRPDLLAINTYDNPMLMSEGTSLPLASIVVVEIKRPMRNDARQGEDKDPVEQALGYISRIREGKAKTPSGRPIPNSSDMPGYCYVLCDLTESVHRRCKLLNLTMSSDGMSYFGFNPNFKSYIEVISFDKLVDSAKKRNRVFFDQLGLPTN